MNKYHLKTPKVNTLAPTKELPKKTEKLTNIAPRQIFFCCSQPEMIMLGLAFVSIISIPQHPIPPTPEKPVKSRETIAVVSMVRSMNTLGLNLFRVRRKTNLLRVFEGKDD